MIYFSVIVSMLPFRLVFNSKHWCSCKLVNICISLHFVDLTINRLIEKIMLKLINNIFIPTTRFFSNNPIYAIKASVVHFVSAFITSIYDIFLCDCLVSASLSRTHTNTQHTQHLLSVMGSMQKPSSACRKSTMLLRESLLTYSRIVRRNWSLSSLYRLVRQFWAWKEDF